MKTRPGFFLLLVLLVVGCGTEPQAEGQWTLASPNGQVEVAVRLSTEDTARSLTYEVALRSDTGRVVVLPASPLGIVRVDEAFAKNLQFVGERRQVIDAAYTLVHGKRSKARNHARELTLTFENPNGARVDLVFRAYDGGVAFRYRFPEEDTTRHTVRKEMTGFRLPKGAAGWMLPRDTVGTYTPAYENLFRKIEAGTSSPTEAGWNFPALFQVKSRYWVLLTEAGLTGAYAGTHLTRKAAGDAYRIAFPDSAEGNGVGAVHPSHTLPWKTPWRVVMVGDELGDIVESSLVTHLSPPSTLEDTSWIQPGKVSWSWWSDSDSPQDPASLRDFIDLAADMGWKYSLIDANWNQMPEDTLRALVDYAENRGVGVLLWYNSGGPHNTVTEAPRNRLYAPERRREELQWLRELGVKGVKVDFFQSDKQETIQLYLDILKDAADYQIMVNFHGCTLPRGWNRTYPHLMTMEAVAGAENYKFNEAYAERAPVHNTILPFTRNVVGPMDYTPVTFSNSTYPHLTTYGHELALSVVFQSSWLHFADRVRAYRKLPAYVKAFLRNVPASWHDIEFIAGYPGRYVVIARRKGTAWYVGGINGEDAPRTVELDFSFLEEGPYTLTLIRDGEDGEHFASGQRTVTAGASLEVEIPPRGGFVMHLTPQDAADGTAGAQH